MSFSIVGSPISSSSSVYYDEEVLESGQVTSSSSSVEEETTSIANKKLSIDRQKAGISKKVSISRMRWNSYEKRLLQEAIATNGNDWDAVAVMVRTRSSVQCKAQYRQQLKNEKQKQHLLNLLDEEIRQLNLKSAV